MGFIKSANEKISFNEVIKDFDDTFSNLDLIKSKIIKVIKKYISNFEHIETGKIRSKNVNVKIFLKDFLILYYQH